ncbi:hypothetical protein ACH5RR_027490 [Cinchona calisaya]|uniref:Uncharacterized protein n=1 Tax=Cinchona calisaya TaxID=153742 RepID=A0ABD2ZAL7_9GENT
MEQNSNMLMMSTEEDEEGLYCEFNKDELEVCEILLNFANLCELQLRQPQSPRKVPFLVRWGIRKRLVCRKKGFTTTKTSSPPNNLATTTAAAAATSKSPSLQNNTSGDGQREVKVVGATSPNTPLCFSTSSTESDDKSSKNGKTNEELKRSIEGLAECKEVLLKQLENVNSYYNELLAYNAKLKAKKQQVLSSSTCCHTREEPNLEVNKSMIVGSNCVQSYQIVGIPNQEIAMESIRPEQLQFHHPYGRGRVQVNQNFLFSSSCRLGKVNNVGPLHIPILNVATEGGTCGVASFQPWDYSRVLELDNNNRAKAALARRHRKMLNQQKSMLKVNFQGGVNSSGTAAAEARRYRKMINQQKSMLKVKSNGGVGVSGNGMMMIKPPFSR